MSGPGEDFTQTPMFRAFQSDRYARQETIRAIQEKTGRTLIVYEANILSQNGSITETDVQPFCDLLARVEAGADLDLMIQSPGGEIDAAEKLVYMCRSVAGGFRLIVPEYAKSAATLIALASDEILMGLASELGPIDPQLQGPGPGGATFQTSAQTFIDEFESIVDEVARTGTLSPAYLPLLDGLNLGFIGMCRNATERSKQFAAKWLRNHMLNADPERADQIAEDLCKVKKWLSHGVVIDADEARKLGISVVKLSKDDDLWKRIWYLHCCYGVLFRTRPIAKVFESDTVSLPFE
jgi:hypothetical protein